MKARSITLTRTAAILGCALLVLSLCAASASAQGFWEKKQWQTWSKDECKKVLEDSPWAQTWTRADVAQDTFGQPTSGTGRESEQQVYYIIQFRSALPVRQAFIRSMQIERKYDKLNADQKAQFDASVDSYLSRKYDDVIVVHVIYGSNISMYAKEMKRIWQSFPADAPPHNITLITSAGVRVQPLKIMTAPGGAMEFELVFPRLVNGEPVLAANVKSVGVEFPHPDLGQMVALGSTQPSSSANSQKVTAPARVYGEFKTEKMMVKGELLY